MAASDPVIELTEEVKQPVKCTCPQGVVIRRIELPFWHTVYNIIKLSIAAVPAMIFVAIFWFCFSALFSGIGVLLMQIFVGGPY